MSLESTRTLRLRGFRRPRLWLAGWVLLLAAVATGSLLPSSELPQVSLHGIDKLQHLLGYALLSGYAVLLFALRRTQRLAGLAVFGYGLALELAQGALTPDRLADPFDALANGVGVLLGLSLAATPAATWLQRLDARLG